MKLRIEKISRRTSPFFTGYWLCLCGFAVIAALVCALTQHERGLLLALLPLTQLFCLVGCVPNRRYLNNISLFTINTVVALRFTVLPLIFCMSGVSAEQYDTKAIGYMIYEVVFVYLMIALLARRLDCQPTGELQLHTDKAVDYLLLLCIPVAIILYPSLITEFSIGGRAEMQGVPGLIAYFFQMGIWVLFVSLILVISRLWSRNILLRYILILVAIGIAVYYVLFNSVDGENVRRWQIISLGVALCTVLIKVFPNSKRFILGLGIVGITVSLIVGTFVKFKDEASLIIIYTKYLSPESLDAYFTGPIGITNGMKITEYANVNTVMSTLTDFFSAVPVLGGMFDFSSYSTQAFYHTMLGRSDVIMPMTAQSVIHFGEIGTPILGMLMTWFAIQVDVLRKKSRDIYSIFVLTQMCIFFSMFMALNLVLIFDRMWIMFMFLFLQFVSPHVRWRVAKKGV